MKFKFTSSHISTMHTCKYVDKSLEFSPIKNCVGKIFFGFYHLVCNQANQISAALLVLSRRPIYLFDFEPDKKQGKHSARKPPKLIILQKCKIIPSQMEV